MKLVTFHSLLGSTNSTSYKVTIVATTLYTCINPIDLPIQIL